MPKKYKIRVHFSRPGSRKGLPWTVHYCGKCHMVKEVVMTGAMWLSEFNPKRKGHPKAFMSGKGSVKIRGGVARCHGEE